MLFQNEKNPNKMNYMYILTPKGVALKTKLTVNFMKRKFKEYEEHKTDNPGKMLNFLNELVNNDEIDYEFGKDIVKIKARFMSLLVMESYRKVKYLKLSRQLCNRESPI